MGMGHYGKKCDEKTNKREKRKRAWLTVNVRLVIRTKDRAKEASRKPTGMVTVAKVKAGKEQKVLRRDLKAEDWEKGRRN